MFYPPHNGILPRMAKKDIGKQAIALHKKLGGKIRISPAMLVKNRAELSLIYTPGVAAVSSLLTLLSLIVCLIGASAQKRS